MAEQLQIRCLCAPRLAPFVAWLSATTHAVAKSDKQIAPIEHDRTCEHAIVGLLTDYIGLFKQLSNRPAHAPVDSHVFLLP